MLQRLGLSHVMWPEYQLFKGFSVSSFELIEGLLCRRLQNPKLISLHIGTEHKL